ncbi:MAG: hypothetical protein HY255_08135 [Betaproteobacteria bacterium]|nr:hypothetical protein [Betaproteobacteria bacterium]
MKTLVAVVLLACLLTVLPSAQADSGVVVRKASVIDVVYMGDKDCPPCVAWKKVDLPKLQAEAWFPVIRFTEIKKPIGDPVPAADQLPEHLRPMQQELVRIINRPRGSPMFALLVDGKAIAGGWGREPYYTFLPRLEELVAGKLAAKN